MKILIISYFFPPYNSIGAVRLGKFARHLKDYGHDIRVISADKQYWKGSLPQTLAVDFPADQVCYTYWLKPPALLQHTTVTRYKAMQTSKRGFAGNVKTFWRRGIFGLYGSFGWIPFAVQQGNRICRQWRPDIILASGLPPSSFIIANKIARKFTIPWVADFRDLWADNHNSFHFNWRRNLERHFEKRTLRRVSGITTVSEPLAEQLRQVHQKEVRIIYNGYDPRDYPPRQQPSTDVLSIVYTGTMIKGRRDPNLLFQAMTGLNKNYHIQVSFYGPHNAWVSALAREYNLEDVVLLHDTVSHARALQLQVNADLLLLLLWDDSAEKGVFSGKVFEYIGAGQPILCLARADNVAARLIAQHKLGFVSQNPDEIKIFLEQQCQRKIHGKHQDRTGQLQMYTRAYQTRELEKFLYNYVKPAHGAP
jgi:glycosyltransferase involved in cell wall biosynthesis